MDDTVTRRTFLKTSTAAATGGMAFPAIIKAQRSQSPNDKVNVAVMGPGGAGGAVLDDAKEENIVCLCDVDEAKAAERTKRVEEKTPGSTAHYKTAPLFNDFRKMFDKMANQIDAVS